MSFWKNLVGIEEEDEDEEELEEFEEQKERKPLFAKKENEEAEVKAEERKPAAPVRTAAPTAKPAAPAAPAKKFTEQIKLVVIEPQSFEESPKLVDNLKAKKPVIINLENLETDVARKIFDFLSGATYALNGNVQKVANNIFLFAPENVDVTYSSGNRQQAQSVQENKSPWA